MGLRTKNVFVVGTGIGIHVCMQERSESIFICVYIVTFLIFIFNIFLH